MSMPPVAVIAGYGPGLGDALRRRLTGAGYRVAGLSRSGRPADSAEKTPEEGRPGFTPVPCDVTDPGAVAAAVGHVQRELGPVSVYVHNAAHLLLKPFLETTPAEFEAMGRVGVLGAVNGAQAVLPGMLGRRSGVLLLIGATASVKGGPRAAAFASAKFALRGLSQSLARACGPQGIHVAHLVIDGVIWSEQAGMAYGMDEAQCLSPDAVAETCLHLIGQHRSAWTLELDVRPDVESF